MLCVCVHRETEGEKLETERSTRSKRGRRKEETGGRKEVRKEEERLGAEPA